MLPKVFVYPEGQRIWLVRASGGKHFQNFLKHGVVAIAHIDKLIKKHALDEIPSRESPNKPSVMRESPQHLIRAAHEPDELFRL